MNYVFPFEKLEVWSLSRKLAVKIYIETGDFPSAEKFGLTDQIKRAVVSVSSNIAEGNSRKNKNDRVRLFNIAFASLMELMSQIIIAVDLGFIREERYHENRLLIAEISNKLNALINNQLQSYHKQ